MPTRCARSCAPRAPSSRSSKPSSSKLTHENAVLKRLKFAARSEGYNADQRSLLEEAFDADQAAVELEIEALQEAAASQPAPKRVPRREPLSANLPRRDVRHDRGRLHGARQAAKFHELWVHHQSPVGEAALKFFAALYDVEREIADADADDRTRLEARRQRSQPVADVLHQWLRQKRLTVPGGSATARAIDYNLRRWTALTRFLDAADLPIDNNWVENRIRPIALGRNNWLFAGSLRAGKRAAAVMSFVHSARLNGLEPHAHLRDVLERLPTHPASRIGELLPHRWRPTAST